MEGQQKLRHLYEKHREHYDSTKLRFPHIYTELSNQTVKVSERLSGHTFDDLLAQGEPHYDTLLNLFQIHGFFLFGTDMVLARAPERDLMNDLKPFLDRFRPWIQTASPDTAIMEQHLVPAHRG